VLSEPSIPNDEANCENTVDPDDDENIHLQCLACCFFLSRVSMIFTAHGKFNPSNGKNFFEDLLIEIMR